MNDLDRYLDGDMTPEERRDLERREPDLLDLQARIDGTILRLVGTPAPDLASDILARGDDFARSNDGSGSGRWRPLLLVAAALVLLAVGGATLWTVRTPNTREVYDRMIALGYYPSWVCSDDDDFRARTLDRFGLAFLVTGGPDVEIIGWRYTPFMSTDTGVLLARVRGEEVILLVDDQPRAVRGPGGDLHRFTRHEQGVVFHEISPFDEPTLLHNLEVGG